MAPLPPPVMVPVNGTRELSEPCMLLLKSIWSRMGYDGSAFTEMQKEIGKELARADFARFERQLLCNEILALKQENNLIRYERDEHLRRANKIQSNLSQVMAAEDRTFMTLMSERELAKNTIQNAQRGVEEVVMAKAQEVERSKAMSEELGRLEKERIAAMKYAKTAEEQAMLASIAAKAATAVAASAVQSNPSTPRPLSHLTPRLPTDRPLSSWGGPSTSYHPSTYATLSSLSHTSSATPSGSYGSSKPSDWTLEDENDLKSKIHERKISSDQIRLLPDDRRSLQDRLNARMERERISSLPSESHVSSSHSHSQKQQQQQQQQQQQPRKKVEWHSPLIGSSSTPNKRY
ncbi:hypothetical protein CROQUDRAFT_657906 [Cronartium quercuum f. sp. fusiforme G11]|uniref:Uncharacterized protein n=1 Tax=Cronartium quercuum f. sp. fusiforme G11 TaxID=708437 RepID=A0A9P6NI07_9BASI|nr:hypothetical protein CROQUDRAFT_657906 [Cronartium quercuum f. sp. fusiforme G11]